MPKDFIVLPFNDVGKYNGNYVVKSVRGSSALPDEVDIVLENSKSELRIQGLLLEELPSVMSKRVNIDGMRMTFR